MLNENQIAFLTCYGVHRPDDKTSSTSFCLPHKSELKLMAYRAYIGANEEFKKAEKERTTLIQAAKKGKKKKESKKKAID